jgi:hypothetical protein
VVEGDLNPRQKEDKKMSKRLYVAYGSNLNVEQMRLRCPSARIIGTAEIDDYELLFKGSLTGSYLTIEKKKGYSVPVAIWEVQPRDEKNLDIYEGYPNFYYKKELTVCIKGIRTGKLQSRRAFVYIMHEDRPLGQPSEYYLNACARGYYFFDFDVNRLIQAVYDSREE